MFLPILLGVALSADPAPRLCLDAAEVDARILAPLRELERTQAEVAALTDERDTLAHVVGVCARDLDAASNAVAVAERRTRRAKRGQARAAGAGAGSVLAILLLLVLL